MGFIEDNLAPGEQVLHRTRLHWIVVFWPIVLTLVFVAATIACLVAWMSSDPAAAGRPRTVWLVLAALAAVVAIVSLMVATTRRAGIEMAVTNRRLIVKSGIIRRRTLEMMPAKVESVSVDQGVLGRMLGYGSVVVRGTGGTAERFDHVADPLRFRLMAQEQVERSQSPAGATAAAPAPAPAGMPAAVARPGDALATRYCSRCGGPLPAGAAFCPRCGTRQGD